MKTSKKISRVVLKIDHNTVPFLIGIVSSEPDYKLSLALNRELKISLKNNTPVRLEDESGSELMFSRFSDVSDSPALTFDLISNRVGKQFLLKKLKNIDYIFEIHSQEENPDIDKLISSLKNTDCVTAVFSIDPASLNDKNLHYLIQ